MVSDALGRIKNNVRLENDMALFRNLREKYRDVYFKSNTMSSTDAIVLIEGPDNSVTSIATINDLQIKLEDIKSKIVDVGDRIEKLDINTQMFDDNNLVVVGGGRLRKIRCFLGINDFYELKRKIKHYSMKLYMYVACVIFVAAILGTFTTTLPSVIGACAVAIVASTWWMIKYVHEHDIGIVNVCKKVKKFAKKCRRRLPFAPKQIFVIDDQQLALNKNVMRAVHYGLNDLVFT